MVRNVLTVLLYLLLVGALSVIGLCASVWFFVIVMFGRDAPDTTTLQYAGWLAIPPAVVLAAVALAGVSAWCGHGPRRRWASFPVAVAVTAFAVYTSFKLRGH